MKIVSKAKAIYNKKYVRTILKIVLVVVLTVSLLLNLFTYVIPVVKHYGNSMEPTLSDSQLLLLYKTEDVEQGDVIAFYYNNKVLVRRVIATPGEQVNIDIFGTVYINGIELNEDYIKDKTLGQSDIEFPYNVPANSVFVLGDSRQISMDSRLSKIGAVSEDRIIGKVIYPFV